jgi:glycosyltransferase involved in cell wall biosynthesis
VPDVSLFHTTHAVPLIMPGVPTITTLHDIIPLRLPYTTLDDKGYFYRLVAELVGKTDHMVTVSEHSRRDIIEFFKISEDRITNTYQSVSIDPAIANMPEADLAEDLEAMHGVGLRDYYLFVGAIEPKKNVGRLIDAYVASGTKRPLILAGGLGWQFKDDLRKINNRRFIYQKAEDGRITTHKMVDHVSYVSRRHLLKLIRGARALIFPSIYEGFGLPVLEAMSLGTPAIASNLSSLPEVTGDAALSVNPYEIDDMARAIRRIDRDDALCEELAKKGRKRAELFSAENYRQSLSALYKRLIG